MKTKKLFRIKVDSVIFVLAENKGEAITDTIRYYLSQHLSENPHEIQIVAEVRSLGNVPGGWLDRVPFGKHLSRLLENVTVREFINRRLFEEKNR